MGESIKVKDAEVGFEVAFIEIPSEAVESGIFMDKKIRIGFDLSLFEDGESGLEHLVGVFDRTKGDARRIDVFA